MFSEEKYKRDIGHLISMKTNIVISYIFVFAVIGIGAGIPLMTYITNNYITIVATCGVGALIGLIIGLNSTWRTDLKIQEAYWRIDVLNEIKKQNSIKNTPFAKTVVAIENNQVPKEEKAENK